MVLKTQSVADADTPNVDLSAMSENERECHVRKMLEDYFKDPDLRLQLKNFIFRKLKSVPDTDDMMQTVFLKAWKGAATYTRDTHIRRWLFRIARNESINFRRKPSNERESLGSEEGFVVKRADRLSSVEPDQDTDFARSQVRRHLETSLMNLQPYFREVVIAVVLDDMSHKEAAAAFGVAQGTIMSRLFRARQALKTTLQYPDLMWQLGAAPEPSEPLELE